MCGINVVYSFSQIEPTDRTLVDRMNSEMRYRGPDDAGLWSDNTVCLGAVRLAIIGLGNGHQPISNEDESLILVCNGEIYNYVELRDALISKGHRFKTETDIEVLIHLYEEHGRDFVKSLKGMFAFALYDSTQRTLVFGRDRLGEKPLYYSMQFGRLLISSEAKTIAIYGQQEVTLDEAVFQETHFSSFPQDPERTLYNEIKRVLPGECITVSSKSFERHRYWNGRRRPTYSSTEDAAAEEVLRLLQQAVRRTMIADVPVAVMLSGGIDSSAIATIASKILPHLSAISVGYEGTSFQDERKEARVLAKDLGIDLHEIELTKGDFLSAFDEYVKVLDEPIWDPASIMQWHIYRRARDLGFKVLLCGLGADELFFGYPSHLSAGRHVECLKRVSSYLPIGRRGLGLFLSDCIRSPREMYSLFRSLGSNEWKWPATAEASSGQAFLNPLGAFWSYQLGNADPLEARFNYLREIYLPLNGFLQSDKLSMAHSVEVRNPFADSDLVDFLLSLPLSMLIKRDAPKWLLRNALKGTLSSSILVAAKKGFQPSEECIRSLVLPYGTNDARWSDMTIEITSRITRNIASHRERNR